MPVLYGVFLYMGVASLNGIQFWDRCKLFLMPAKHQPDYAFLRHVPLRRIHLFTMVQIICLAVLWILKSTVAAIIFPVMILALILVRKMLDFVFSQHDLAWIDNIIPEKDKKKEDDKKKKKRKGNKGEEEDNSDEPKFPPPSVITLPLEPVPSEPPNNVHCTSKGSHSVESLEAAMPKEVFQLEPCVLTPLPMARIWIAVVRQGFGQAWLGSQAFSPGTSGGGRNKGQEMATLYQCDRLMPSHLRASSITLHLKISCPSSPAFNYSRNPICAVPQVKIEMESDYEDTNTEKPPPGHGQRDDAIVPEDSPAPAFRGVKLQDSVRRTEGIAGPWDLVCTRKHLVGTHPLRPGAKRKLHGLCQAPWRRGFRTATSAGTKTFRGCAHLLRTEWRNCSLFSLGHLQW
ncbi:hypothetical protein lerEdw1_013924 [Lerista edwardsae]|nr:hypothetical protein lerEdw1_013924 [Lerista edwardsae]